jgi:hypothetical protein
MTIRAPLFSTPVPAKRATEHVVQNLLLTTLAVAAVALPPRNLDQPNPVRRVPYVQMQQAQNLLPLQSVPLLALQTLNRDQPNPTLPRVRGITLDPPNLLPLKSVPLLPLQARQNDWPNPTRARVRGITLDLPNLLPLQPVAAVLPNNRTDWPNPTLPRVRGITLDPPNLLPFKAAPVAPDANSGGYFDYGTSGERKRKFRRDVEEIIDALAARQVEVLDFDEEKQKRELQHALRLGGLKADAAHFEELARRREALLHAELAKELQRIYNDQAAEAIQLIAELDQQEIIAIFQEALKLLTKS